MARITDVRTTIWEWIGPVAPMPPHFCTTAGDIVSDVPGSIAGFRFLGWLVVEIECDDGTVGIGNAALAPHATKATIDTYLKPLLIGADPLDTEYLWQSMYRRTLPFGRKGIGMTAISAVDLALWDAKGKILNQPVFKLLGGRTKPKIPVYASRLYSQPLDTLYAEAKAYADEGFKAVKLRFGWGPKDGLEGINKNLELVKTTREAVGPDVDIMADAYMGWNVEYGKRMLRQLEPHNLRWVEEPVISDDLAGYAELKAMNKVGISGGEHEYTLHGFRQAMDLRAFDIAQFDVNRVGGITAAKKITDLCEAYDVAVIPHAGQMHNYHITMSSFGAPISEYFPKVPVEVGNELFWYIFDGEPVAKDGFIDLADDKPGFGLTLQTPDPKEFKLTR
ncbi:L-rhamnonate dehydratase [Mariluticola halotolerans]|uniref:L-rhamnonate dehydratase n=1 Tax=Mariluticola halotolerans TaxID=2909283 RepID=UPI0026E27682|nr:L-rhamnonate dehydratase [Mariluticola halotolerans]UJQ94285.1 L-rhamnonate dehydratase [Mariluticola halotolerans]